MKNNTRSAACALVLCAMSILAVSSALAQACTPVVYAFRHAEDTNPPGGTPGGSPPLFALTPTGQRHAELYPTMIEAFQSALAADKKPNNFCPVGKVYATTTVKKVGSCGDECDSATNAYDTAKPLASATMGKPPITRLCDYPEGATKEQVRACELYEYLGNGNSAPTAPNYSTDVAKELRKALLETAKGGKSSAIFWTSQGLHLLGSVIISADTQNIESLVPIKNGWTIPGRNAVYVFKAKGAAGSYTGFEDTPKSSGPVAASTYIQCFNYDEGRDPANNVYPHFITTAGQMFCGYGQGSSLGGKPGPGGNCSGNNCNCDLGAQCSSISNDGDPKAGKPPSTNKDVTAKICNTVDDISPDTGGANKFGRCSS